ncbi:MAG: hypothetical protein ACYCQI_13780 [Gammaproteobacteria bacterium]
MQNRNATAYGHTRKPKLHHQKFYEHIRKPRDVVCVQSRLSLFQEQDLERKTNFNQIAIINRVNDYVRKYNAFISGNPSLKMNYVPKKELPVTGCCHGITWTWLQFMSTNQPQKLYALYQKIMSPQDHFGHSIHMPIEIFLAFVDKAHRASRYFKNMTWRTTYKIFAMHSICDSGGEVTPSQIYEKMASFSKEKEYAMCLSASIKKTQDGKDFYHSIGLYFKDSTFYVYDPNYKEGKPKEFKDLKDVIEEFGKCMYDDFGVKRPEFWDIKFNVVKSIRPEEEQKLSFKF